MLYVILVSVPSSFSYIQFSNLRVYWPQMSRFRNHSSSTFERESSPLPKSYQAGVRHHISQQKSASPPAAILAKVQCPPYLLMHFLVCVGWMWFVLQYYYIHTHCRKVIFVIFIISTISCRKTIIRTKSIYQVKKNVVKHYLLEIKLTFCVGS